VDSLIIEQQDLWQRLQETKKPVVLYGMGDGALKIMAVLRHYGIPLRGIFASEGFVRGHSFEGFPVRRLADLEAELGELVILLCFAIHDEPMTVYLHDLAKRHELYAPDVPVAGENLFTLDFYRRHEARFQWVYERLGDEQSKLVYRNILNFKLSGKLDYLSACESSVEEAYENLLRPGPSESFVDLGAYKGDTIQELLRFSGGTVEQVLAFEPDRKNYKKLCQTVEALGLSDRATLLNAAAYKEPGLRPFAQKAGRQSALSAEGVLTPVDSVDHVLAGKRLSLVNMDVEGGEREALEGCKESIRRWKPKLLLAAYHRSEDLFALPEQVLEIEPSYRLYFRHYRYIPAWDTNLYALPPEEQSALEQPCLLDRAAASSVK